MDSDQKQPVVTVRTAQFPTDSATVARLVGDYLRQTEREKAERGLAAAFGTGLLPDRYQAEVDSPESAFAALTVLVAEADGQAVGVAVVAIEEATGLGEIKRLWVAPDRRGSGIGRRLLETAVSMVPGTTRLSVWDWRGPAIHSYQRLGFVEVPSWETRKRLICMERPGS